MDILFRLAGFYNFQYLFRYVLRCVGRRACLFVISSTGASSPFLARNVFLWKSLRVM